MDGPDSRDANGSGGRLSSEASQEPGTASQARATEIGEARPSPPPLPKAEFGWRDLIVALAIIWGITLGMQFAVGFGLGFWGAVTGGDAQAVYMQPVVLVPLAVFGLLVGLGVAWYFACAKYGRSVREGFAIQAVKVRPVVSGAVVGLAGAAGAVALTWNHETSNSLMGELVSVTDENGTLVRPSALMMLFAVLVPPLEEMYYRGFLYTAFRKLTSVRIAFPLIVAWFASIHVFQLAGDWGQLLWVAMMGGFWTWLRERHDSVVPSLVSHWIYNAALVGTTLAMWLAS